MDRKVGKGFEPFTPRMAWDLMAAHTWPAAIIPALIALCAASLVGPISFTLALDMLVIVILMQSSANVFNDYFDFVKGTDKQEHAVEESDAVLVYNHADPRCALALAIGLLVVAFLLGIYPLVMAGWIPLLIAVIGAACVALYSAGKTSLSYLPLGEIVSGGVMGILIPLAIYYVLTGELSGLMVIWSIPVALGIGLIMATNNISDIERDAQANRHTLAVILGRERARALYRAMIILWLVLLVAITLVWFLESWPLLIFLVLAAYPFIKALWDNPLNPERRKQSMPQILTLNMVLGLFYGCIILASQVMILMV